MDLSPVAHLAAIEGKTPFLNFFDGFRTSHEIQKVAMWDYKDLADMCDMDAVQAFRDHALNPEHPHTRGSHENGDIFFQNREACNKVYDELPAVVEGYMKKINEKLGTDYGLFNYYGAPDADRVVVCMGSFCDVLEEVIDYLNAHGEKVGLVKVRLFRPFSIKHFVDVLPETVKKIAVMDRTKEPVPSASRSTRTSSPLSTRPARRVSRSSAAVTAWAARTRLPRPRSLSSRSSRRTSPSASSPSASSMT